MHKPWVNAIAYQLVWFAAVIGANHDLAWPGVLAALVFLTATLRSSPHRALDLRLITLAMLCGLVIDTACAWLELVHYAAPMAGPWPFIAPSWILALWASFSATLTRSMRWLLPRPWLGVLLGALGAPLAYRGAAALGTSVILIPPTWQALVALGTGWAVAMAMLLSVSPPRTPLEKSPS